MDSTKNISLFAIFSNLSKAAEKQQLFGEAELYRQLADNFYKSRSEPAGFQDLKDHITKDLSVDYSKIQKKAEEDNDRGILRALKWGQKVTTIQKTLIDRFLATGEEFLENKDLFVCEACGFISLGTGSPDICPVCKAPKSRFSKIK